MIRQPWLSPHARATSAWLQTASVDERLLAAEITTLAYACDTEADLARVALSLDLEPEWGESISGLRLRVIWKGKYYYRVRPPREPMPPVVLRWWARLARELPESWRAPFREFVDKIRGASR
jgi:hypothetical protein